MSINKRIIDPGLIPPTPISQTCDFFGDGSAEGFWQFEQNWVDTCGTFSSSSGTKTNAWATGAKFGTYSTDSPSYFYKSLTTRVINSNVIISVWLKGQGLNPTATNYVLDDFPYDLSVSSTNILTASAYDVNGVSDGRRYVNYDLTGVNINVWHHVGVTTNTTTSGNKYLKLYFDGQLVDSYAALSGTWGATFGRININARVNNNKWQGQTDHLRIFSGRVPSDQDITDLYNEGQ
jgi:hypothetical protein